MKGQGKYTGVLSLVYGRCLIQWSQKETYQQARLLYLHEKKRS